MSRVFLHSSSWPQVKGDELRMKSVVSAGQDDLVVVDKQHNYCRLFALSNKGQQWRDICSDESQREWRLGYLFQIQIATHRYTGTVRVIAYGVGISSPNVCPRQDPCYVPFSLTSQHRVCVIVSSWFCSGQHRLRRGVQGRRDSQPRCSAQSQGHGQCLQRQHSVRVLRQNERSVEGAGGAQACMDEATIRGG